MSSRESACVLFNEILGAHCVNLEFPQDMLDMAFGLEDTCVQRAFR